MTITYRKAADVTLTAPSWLFIGGPGTGKSTLIGQAAEYLRKIRGGDFLIINGAPKEKAVCPAIIRSGAMVVDQPKWPDIVHIMTADFGKFTAGIAIDELAWYAKAAMYDLLGVKDDDKSRLDTKEFVINQYHWTVWGERIRKHFDLIVQRGIPIIVTGHVKIDKDEISGEIFKSVNLWGKPAIDIPALFTVCGMLNYVAAASETWECRFRPERGFPARDTLGRLAPVERSNFEHLWCIVMGTTCSCPMCAKAKAGATPAVVKP